jgi:hypothetical protein
VTISVAEASQTLVERRLLERERFDHSALIIDHVSELTGRALPSDLVDFYRQRIKSVGDFGATPPVRSGRTGWRTRNDVTTWLLAAGAIPIFSDGCGSLFGVDLLSAADHPAVYFFDHEDNYEKPSYAAGSSIGAFLLLLAEHDAALDERRPPGWELTIDPDLGRCPRAPPIWRAG